MKIKLSLLCLLVACISSTYARQASVYSTTNNLLGSEIWDISGVYDDEIDGDDFTYTLIQDGKGKFSGGGSTYFEEIVDGYTMSFDMTFQVKGSIKAKKGIITVKQKMPIKIAASYMGMNKNFKGSISMTAVIDTGSKIMTGTSSVSIMGYKETESFSEPLEDDDMDGSATIITTLYEIEGKLLGEAIIELSNERKIDCLAKAKIKTKTDTLLVQAKGDKYDLADKGSKLKLVYADDEIIAIKGKVCGQAISFSAPPPPTTLPPER